MATPSVAYVQWYEEDIEGAATTRRVRAAWLVRDVVDESGRRQEALAYLGHRSAVTPTLREELGALFPDVTFDWESIACSLAGESGWTNVAALTDDELAFGMTRLAQERGLSLVDLALHLGYRQRQILPELQALLGDATNVARFERTSGSVFDYMVDHHPEYAYLIYKARLLFQGESDALAAAISSEPKGFGDAAWRARRRLWRERLTAYAQRRRPPPA